MDISILVSWKTVPRPFGWSIGMCPHCNEVMPVRIDEVLQRFAIYFIPVFETRVGFCCNCDLCDRVLGGGLPERRVRLTEWKPSNGIATLAEKLDFAAPMWGNETDAIYKSLLASVTDMSSIHSLDVSFGLTSGCIFGAVLGAYLGYYYLSSLLPDMDQFGRVAAGILGGLVIGGVIGAAITALVRQRTLPYSRFKAAIQNYSLDGSRLVQLSDNYPLRVRRAVVRARDSANLERLAR